MDEIRTDTFIAELTNKNHIEDVSFGNNTKYIIVRYRTRFEIYHIGQWSMLKRSYVPESFELPKDQLEKICDHFFWSNDLNDNYRCYLACKVSGMKKIKVFNIKHMNRDSIWETDANSINFFEEVSENFMVRMKLDGLAIKTIFVNGSEQFTITMFENGETC